MNIWPVDLRGVFTIRPIDLCATSKIDWDSISAIGTCAAALIALFVYWRTQHDAFNRQTDKAMAVAAVADGLVEILRGSQQRLTKSDAKLEAHLLSATKPLSDGIQILTSLDMSALGEQRVMDRYMVIVSQAQFVSRVADQVDRGIITPETLGPTIRLAVDAAEDASRIISAHVIQRRHPWRWRMARSLDQLSNVAKSMTGGASGLLSKLRSNGPSSPPNSESQG